MCQEYCPWLLLMKCSLDQQDHHVLVLANKGNVMVRACQLCHFEGGGEMHPPMFLQDNADLEGNHKIASTFTARKATSCALYLVYARLYTPLLFTYLLDKTHHDNILDLPD